MSPFERINKADDQWTASAETEAQRKAELFEAFAAAVRDGHTPDEIAVHLRTRKTPSQIAAGLTFSGPYIRKRVRETGVPALPHGPKPRTNGQPKSET